MLIELKLLGKKTPPVDQVEPVVSSREPEVEAPLTPLAAATAAATDLRTEEPPIAAPAEPAASISDGQMGTRILLCASFMLTIWYLNTSALKYLTPSPETYGIFWGRYEWLFAHAVAGTVALLLGPLQFWPGLKQKRPMLHRSTGSLYVGSVGIGALAALYLAFHTDFGWMYAMGLTSMALAWIISTGLASVAIYRGLIPQHREWMIRSYVITFGFVTLRLVTDVLDSRGIGTIAERLALGSWVSWSVPLLITEALLQGRKVFAPMERDRSTTI